MIESGYLTFNMPGWGGLLATAGTPKDVIVKLNAAVAELLCIAREYENKEIVQLVYDLRRHEKIENQVMYCGFNPWTQQIG